MQSQQPLTQYILCIDSRDRDAARFPDGGRYDVTLPQRYILVEKVELLDLQVPTTFYIFDSTNNTLAVKLLNGATVIESATVTLPVGNFTISDVASAFASALNSAFSLADFTVALNSSTLRLSITNTGGFNIQVDTRTVGVDLALDTEWGLGYYLGFKKNDVITASTLIPPRPVNVNPITYLYLDIDPLNFIDVSGEGGGTKYAFAKVPVSVSNTVAYLDERTSAFPPCDLQTPLGKLAKLGVTWKKHGSNDPINFQGFEHSFTLRVTCRDRIPAVGGTMLTESGRIMC